MKFITKNRIPLIVIEVYLVFTLLLYQFGPINWNTESPVKFWIFITLYHIAFILGYLFADKKIKFDSIKYKQNFIEQFLIQHIFLFFLICTICSIILYRNVTHSNNWVPLDFFENLIQGILHPGRQYYVNIQNTDFQSTKLITVFFACFSFVYTSLMPIGIFLWKKFKIQYKLWYIILVFFYFGTYIGIGTNKGIFNVMITITVSLTLYYFINKDLFNELIKNKKIIIPLLALVTFTVLFFGWTMYSRNNTHSINPDNSTSTDLDDKSNIFQDLDEYINTLIYRIDDYLTQGYYGMSLALDEPFTTTYGIGHSDFLKSNFKSLFGIDVQERTYQYKTNDEWDSQTKWHSFYGYWANDISFYGVILLMFIIGVYTAILWKDIIINKNLIAFSLFPLFMIMFFNMPGNNMIFTSMQHFCAFWELTFLYTLEKVFIKKGSSKNE